MLRNILLLLIAIFTFCNNANAFLYASIEKSVIGKWIYDENNSFEFKKDGILIFRFEKQQDNLDVKYVVNNELLSKYPDSDLSKGISVGSYEFYDKNKIKIELPLYPVFNGWPNTYNAFKVSYRKEDIEKDSPAFFLTQEAEPKRKLYLKIFSIQ